MFFCGVNVFFCKNLPKFFPKFFPDLRFVALDKTSDSLLLHVKHSKQQMTLHVEGAHGGYLFGIVRDQVCGDNQGAVVLHLQQQETKKKSVHQKNSPKKKASAKQATAGGIHTLWLRYDVNANGKLDVAEMKTLIGDLCFVRRGHRNVPAKEEKEAIARMSGGAKNIDFNQFKRFVNRGVGHAKAVPLTVPSPENVQPKEDHHRYINV